MEEEFKGNQELKPPDIFSALNNYVLLFFSMTCVMSSVFIQQLFFTLNQVRVGMVVAPVLGIMLPVYLITRRFPAGFRRQLLIRRPGVLLCAYVVLATLFMVVIVDFMYVVSQLFMNAPEDYIAGLKALKPSGTWEIALTFLGICVLVPIGEEIVFRGMIQRVFGRNMSPALAMLLAGAFFGVIHLTPQLLLSMVVFGVFLGYLFFATSNLVYPILAHFVLNTVSYVQLVALPRDQLASVPSYASNPIALGLSFALVAYLLFRIEKTARVPANTR